MKIYHIESQKATQPVCHLALPLCFYLQADPSASGALTGLQVVNEAEAVQEWRLYMVQEFCNGGSLRQAIEASVFGGRGGKGPVMVRTRGGGGVYEGV